MAPVTCLAPVYLLLLSIVSVAAAPPRSLGDHEAITAYNPLTKSVPVTSVDLAVTDHADKRGRQPVGSWGEQYALAHGWSVTVTTLSVFASFGSQGAADWLNDFYWSLQATCAAKMLSNSPYVTRIAIVQNQWKLVLAMHPQSTVKVIEWSFAYYFARYMQNWVLNGFTGTGAIMFQHPSGVKLVAFFLNMEGSVGSVLH